MKTYEKKIIVVVNAYSSGSQLAAHFNNKGFTCLHVTTAAKWKDEASRRLFRERDFIKTIVVENEKDIQLAALELSRYNIQAIIPGAESGVSLSDNLSNVLGCSLNNYTLSSARRNKFDMHEVLKKNNLKSIKQIKASSIDDVIKWKNENRYKRIVLKPLSSVASDSVFYCDDELSIYHAFSAIYKKNNLFGYINDEVLVQEYIDGFEYIVNTVSCNKKHVVLDIWQGFSLNKNIVSNDIYADIVDPNSKEYQSLCSYISKVLDAIGIMNGAGHSEVRITSNGPCLIETGARLAGRVDFKAVEYIYGDSQLSLLVESIANPEAFLKKTNTKILPKVYSRYVYFASEVEGVIKNDVLLDDFSAIESLFSIKFYIKKGDILQKTSKPLRARRPGFAYLVSEDKSKIERDYLLIKNIEKNFYSKLIS